MRTTASLFSLVAVAPAFAGDRVPGKRWMRYADPADAGYCQWSLACTSPVPPIPEIVRAAVAAGWDVAAIGPESQSLEEVFRTLMDRHAAGATSEVTA